MPESKKVTLDHGGRVEAVLGQRPDLQLVTFADMTRRTTWTFLSRVSAFERVELIDFFHEAASQAMPSMRPMEPIQGSQFEKYRHLRYDDDGVTQVIRALRHLRSKHRECERIAQVLCYFRNNRHRMGYAEAKDQGFYRFRGGGGDMQDLGH